VEREASLTAAIRRQALELGFVRVGFARAERFATAAKRLESWLGSGHAGTMSYLAGGTDRADPHALLAEAQTIIAVALPYPAGPGLGWPRRSRDGGPAAAVARYARGDDYHRVLKDKLRVLALRCEELVGRPVLSRSCVDTAPLLEREAALRAGIGFTGKSTMTIAPGIGSYIVIGELLVDIELEPDEPIAQGCGSCRACLDACPTRAFIGEWLLDARRCISYLTIEYRGVIARELRPLMGSRVFGCDVCQEVCPFNASSAPRAAAPELAPRAALDAIGLVELLEMRSAAYRRLVRGSALRRASRTQLARNAAIALGNSGDERAVGPLVASLRSDARALVRGHAAWALGRLGGAQARSALEAARRGDPDAWVREEAELALADARGA
jgi:epoxyqueuosine reductase